MSAWAVRAVPVPAGRSVHLDPLVVTGGENSGLYGCKTTWRATMQIIEAASVASTVFLITLVMSLGVVGARGLHLGVGVWIGPLLQQCSDVQPTVHARSLLLQLQAWDLS